MTTREIINLLIAWGIDGVVCFGMGLWNYHKNQETTKLQRSISAATVALTSTWVIIDCIISRMNK